MTLEQRNAYLKKYNLEALDTQEHDLKTKYQNYLSAELKAKRMTKKEVTTKMANWKEELYNANKGIKGLTFSDKDIQKIKVGGLDKFNEIQQSKEIVLNSNLNSKVKVITPQKMLLRT